MMIGGSLFSVLPKGFFNWPTATVHQGAVNVDVPPMIDAMIEKDEGERKRRRDHDASGRSTTPTLISTVSTASTVDGSEDIEDESSRPRKRPRSRSILTSVLNLIGVSAAEDKRKKPTSDLLRIVPEDVIAHCLSFLGTTEDRFALQTTCKSFRNLSNSDSMLEKLNICGNKETGKNGIIQETDTPATASATLEPFARAGNLEALYM
jgi:F-box domain